MLVWVVSSMLSPWRHAVPCSLPLTASVLATAGRTQPQRGWTRAPDPGSEAGLTHPSETEARHVTPAEQVNDTQKHSCYTRRGCSSLVILVGVRKNARQRAATVTGFFTQFSRQRMFVPGHAQALKQVVLTRGAHASQGCAWPCGSAPMRGCISQGHEARGSSSRAAWPRSARAPEAEGI